MVESKQSLRLEDLTKSMFQSYYVRFVDTQQEWSDLSLPSFTFMTEMEYATPLGIMRSYLNVRSTFGDFYTPGTIAQVILSFRAPKLKKGLNPNNPFFSIRVGLKTGQQYNENNKVAFCPYEVKPFVKLEAFSQFDTDLVRNFALFSYKLKNLEKLHFCPVELGEETCTVFSRADRKDYSLFMDQFITRAAYIGKKSGDQFCRDIRTLAAAYSDFRLQEIFEKKKKRSYFFLLNQPFFSMLSGFSAFFCTK